MTMTEQGVYPYPGDIVEYTSSFGNIKTVLVDWSGWDHHGHAFSGTWLEAPERGQQVWGWTDEIIKHCPLYPDGYHYCVDKPFQISCQHNDGECCVECVRHGSFVTLRHDDTVVGCVEAWWVFDDVLRDWLAVQLLDIFLGRAFGEEEEDLARAAVDVCNQTVGVERLFNLMAWA